MALEELRSKSSAGSARSVLEEFRTTSSNYIDADAKPPLLEAGQGGVSDEV